MHDTNIVERMKIDGAVSVSVVHIVYTFSPESLDALN